MKHSVDLGVRHLVAAGLLGFVLGAFVVGSLGTVSRRAGSPMGAIGKDDGVDGHVGAVVETPAPTSGRTGVIPKDAPESKELSGRRLAIPVTGIDGKDLVRSYHDARSGGRDHEAIDILAPHGTPVVAVENGTIAKLFTSKAGGITLYQFDPGKEFAYYYAHLDRYADGITEGQAIARGQVIGYVGVSGNAPKDTPHLHFAIFRLTAEKQWWQGTPVDPYEILR